MWKHVPKSAADQIIDLVLEQIELSPRQLTVRFTDDKHHAGSEVTVSLIIF